MHLEDDGTVRQAPQRLSVLGQRIDALTMTTAIEHASDAIESRRKGSVFFSTVSSVLSGVDDKVVQDAFERAMLVTPDGMPLVWLARRRGLRVERVYGPDFLLAFLQQTGGKYRHYFFGGDAGVPETLIARLKSRFPEAQLVGGHAPGRIVPDDVPADEIARINKAMPDVLWVGLGHPKQELFASLNQDAIDAPVIAAVGAAFDFHSGRVKEAPPWMKRSGLQWLHRLASDPKRLWRRYLLGNSRFVYLLVKEGIRKKLRRSDRAPS